MLARHVLDQLLRHRTLSLRVPYSLERVTHAILTGRLILSLRACVSNKGQDSVVVTESIGFAAPQKGSVADTEAGTMSQI